MKLNARHHRKLFFTPTDKFPWLIVMFSAFVNLVLNVLLISHPFTPSIASGRLLGNQGEILFCIL